MDDVACVLLAAGHTQLTAGVQKNTSGQHVALQSVPKVLLPDAKGNKLLDHWWRLICRCTQISRTFIVTNANKYKHFERWAGAAGFPLANIINNGSTLATNGPGAAADLELAVRSKGLLLRDVLVIQPEDMLEVPLMSFDTVLDGWNGLADGDVAVCHRPPCEEDRCCRSAATAAGPVIELAGPQNRLVRFLDTVAVDRPSCQYVSLPLYGFSPVTLALLTAFIKKRRLQHSEYGASPLPSDLQYFVTECIEKCNRAVYGIPLLKPGTSVAMIADGTLSQHCDRCMLTKNTTNNVENTATSTLANGVENNSPSTAAGRVADSPISTVVSNATNSVVSRAINSLSNTAANGLSSTMASRATTNSSSNTVVSNVANCNQSTVVNIGGVPRALTSVRGFTARAYARVGLIGNPSDGFHGKTIALTIANFWSDVTIMESPTLRLIPHPINDPTEFGSLSDLHGISSREGYLGGLRLLQATCKKFYHYCSTYGIELSQRNFSLQYDTNIPRQVGLAGSSAIITATLHALMAFYAVRDEQIPEYRRPQLVLDVEEEELCIRAGLQDRVVQVYEGLVYMDFNKELMDGRGYGRYERLVLPEGVALPGLFLVYRPDASDSGKMHSDVRQRWRDGDAVVMEGMAELGRMTEQARQALVEADWHTLGTLMCRNFEVRERMYGAATLGPHNLRMVATARRHRVPAKLPGSGGAVLGLAVGGMDMERLREEYQADGCVVVDVIPQQAGARTLHAL